MGNHCEKCESCDPKSNAQENKDADLQLVQTKDKMEEQKVGLLENISLIQEGLKTIKLNIQFQKLIQSEGEKLLNSHAIWYSTQPRKMYIWRNDNPENSKDRASLFEKCKVAVLLINEKSEQAQEFYYGNIKQHLADDQDGLYINYQGIVYRGGFQFSQFMGKGKYVNSELEYSLEGQWINNYPHGECCEKTREGTYTGSFQSGKKEGKGTFEGKQKTFYGQWKDGLMSEGLLRSNEGNYKGNFLKGKKNGLGIWTHKGQKYDGSWKQGVKEGQGTYTFQNGSIYEGSFHHDLPHGEGKVTINGKVFEGLWREGKNVFSRSCQ